MPEDVDIVIGVRVETSELQKANELLTQMIDNISKLQGAGGLQLPTTPVNNIEALNNAVGKLPDVTKTANISWTSLQQTLGMSNKELDDSINIISRFKPGDWTQWNERVAKGAGQLKYTGDDYTQFFEKITAARIMMDRAVGRSIPREITKSMQTIEKVKPAIAVTVPPVGGIKELEAALNGIMPKAKPIVSTFNDIGTALGMTGKQFEEASNIISSFKGDSWKDWTTQLKTRATELGYTGKEFESFFEKTSAAKVIYDKSMGKEVPTAIVRPTAKMLDLTPRGLDSLIAGIGAADPLASAVARLGVAEERETNLAYMMANAHKLTADEMAYLKTETGLSARQLESYGKSTEKASNDFKITRAYIVGVRGAIGPLGYAFRDITMQLYWASLGFLFLTMTMTRNEKAALQVEQQTYDLAKAFYNVAQLQKQAATTSIEYGNGSEEARQANVRLSQAERELILQQKQLAVATKTELLASWQQWFSMVPMVVNTMYMFMTAMGSMKGLMNANTVATGQQVLANNSLTTAQAQGAGMGWNYSMSMKAVGDSQLEVAAKTPAAVTGLGALKAALFGTGISANFAWAALTLGIGLLFSISAALVMNTIAQQQTDAAMKEVTKSAQDQSNAWSELKAQIIDLDQIYRKFRVTIEPLFGEDRSVTINPIMPDIPPIEVDVPPVEVPTIPPVKFEIPKLPKFDTVKVDQLVVPRLPMLNVSPIYVPDIPMLRIANPTIPSIPQVQFASIEIPSIPKVEFAQLIVPKIPMVQIGSLVVPNIPKVQFEQLKLPVIPPLSVGSIIVPHIPTLEVESIDTPIFPMLKVNPIPTPNIPRLDVNPITIPNIPAIPPVQFAALEVPDIAAVKFEELIVPKIPSVGFDKLTIPTIPPIKVNQLTVPSIPSIPPVQFAPLIIPDIPPVEVAQIQIPDIPTLQFATIKVPAIPKVQIGSPSAPDIPEVQFASIRTPIIPPLRVRPILAPTLPEVQFAHLTMPDVPPLKVNKIIIPSIPSLKVETPIIDIPDVPRVEFSQLTIPRIPSVSFDRLTVPPIPHLKVDPIVAPKIPILTVEQSTIDIPTIPPIEFASINIPKIPDVEVAPIEVPRIPIVTFAPMNIPAIPEIQVADIEVPRIADIPDVKFAAITIPKIPAVKVPKVDYPRIHPVTFERMEVPEFPDIKAPKIQMPEMPEITMPSLNIPKSISVESPRIDIPNIPSIKFANFKVPDIPRLEVSPIELPTLPELQVSPIEVATNIKVAVEEPRIKLDTKLLNSVESEVTRQIKLINTMIDNLNGIDITVPDIDTSGLKTTLNKVGTNIESPIVTINTKPFNNIESAVNTQVKVINRMVGNLARIDISMPEIDTSHIESAIESMGTNIPRDISVTPKFNNKLLDNIESTAVKQVKLINALLGDFSNVNIAVPEINTSKLEATIKTLNRDIEITPQLSLIDNSRTEIDTRKLESAVSSPNIGNIQVMPQLTLPETSKGNTNVSINFNGITVRKDMDIDTISSKIDDIFQSNYYAAGGILYV
jgi:hypothetical protein